MIMFQRPIYIFANFKIVVDWDYILGISFIWVVLEIEQFILYVSFVTYRQMGRLLSSKCCGPK